MANVVLSGRRTRQFEQYFFYDTNSWGEDGYYNGNIVQQITITDADTISRRYQYDALDRVTIAFEQMISSTLFVNYEVFEYDDNGNMTAYDVYPNPLQPFYCEENDFAHWSNTNRLKSINPFYTNQFLYDNNGNRSFNDHRNYYYTYDYRNRLARTDLPPDTLGSYVEYGYNQSGWRVLKNHYYEWYDDCTNPGGGPGGGEEMMVMGGFEALGGPIGPPPNDDTCYYDGRVKTQYVRSFNKTLMQVPPYGMTGFSYRYIFAGDDRIAMKEMFDEEYTYYYLKDHLGSSRIMMEETGNLSDVYNNYRTFGLQGTQTIGVNQDYRFTGKPHDDESGLNMDYFGARYYDPLSQRFMAVDPLHGKYPSLSPYAYCANNPIKLVDPDGRVTEIYSVPIGSAGINTGRKHIFARVKNKKLGVNTSKGYYPKNRAAAFFNSSPFINFQSGNDVVLKTDLTSELGEVIKLESGKESDATLEATISPPDDMSQDEFDQSVLDAFDNQSLENVDYDMQGGTNSNTLIDNTIESTGATMPDIPGATSQNNGEKKQEKKSSNGR